MKNDPLWTSYEALEAASERAGYATELEAQGLGPEAPDGMGGEESLAELTMTAAEATPSMDGFSRRTFLGVMGAGAAAAGVGLSGCIRKPVTTIVPHRVRPEEQIPGVAVYYATCLQEGATVQGILVESHDGRPTKIEGNPLHGESLGATNASMQGAIVGLYDLDRSTQPRGPRGADGKSPTLAWDAAWKVFEDAAMLARKGKFGVVTATQMSPTARRLMATLKAAAPDVRFFNADVFAPEGEFAAATAIGGAGSYPVTHLEHADVIASFDHDFLGRDHSSVRHTKAFSAGRKASTPGAPMNRLYVAEATFSVTGAMADHRVRTKSGDVGKLLVALAQELAAHGVTVDAGALGRAATPAGLDAQALKYVKALAKDLAGAKPRATVSVGHRQPAWVHGLALAVNTALQQNGGKPAQTLHQDPSWVAQESLLALAAALDTQQLTTVFVIDANPVLSAGTLELAKRLRAVTTIHAGTHYDETARVSALHLPTSHFLEAWGDLVSLTGVAAIVQPLIAPLHFTPSGLEVLARLATGGNAPGYDLVRDTWKSQPDWSEKTWQRWLHDGIVDTHTAPPAPASLDWSKVGDLVAVGSAQATAKLEINFHVDALRLDGRYANCGWLQEAPDPMTKLTWDNAALANKKTAQTLFPGATNGDVVAVTVGGAKVELPLFLMPGQADSTVALWLGHGRDKAEPATNDDRLRIASLHGFDVYAAMPAGAWYADGQAAIGSGSVPLANVQPFGNSQTPTWSPAGERDDFGPSAARKNLLHDKHAVAKEGEKKPAFPPRSLVLEASRDEYKADPEFAGKILDQVMKGSEVRSHIYPKSARTPNSDVLSDYFNGVHQWAMSIDLNACTGCSACLVACQAENNIPVVGKDRVLRGREMHWIRIDRYFAGDADEPEAVLQPLPCQQCETAPCEAVCPVKATAHTNEGLNDMAYNRCIGTRYCSNNCPYKVRRFNYFNYNLDIHPLTQMQKNPNVTIRFRGVIEKCTYCVQRISAAKIEAKVQGDGRVKDGRIKTACQQVCPADAIVFGDKNDKDSAVSKTRSEPRNYQILRELNTRPRTTYLAKLRNPNPDLGA